ncbi:hypothetical protein [Alloactinosynnema sp. L-07]|nr:hypothetical protein [Alloactinosynnema sp. L-07]
MEVGGRDYGSIGADHGDIWATEMRERMRALQLPARAVLLAHHVEMKVVAMMVKSGARSGRTIINHAPCGFRTGRRYRLRTVLGGRDPEM